MSYGGGYGGGSRDGGRGGGYSNGYENSGSGAYNNYNYSSQHSYGYDEIPLKPGRHQWRGF
jgi:ATP-dependent RNA helicase DDX5/DBP2